MEAQHSQSLSSLPDGLRQQHPFHQEPSNAHEPLSESSQTYSHAPSSTGDGTAEQSVTTPTEHGEPNHDQTAFAHQSVITFLSILP
jgi:hypothetical protein